MGKRQKLILMFYAFSVFIISFIYVPYNRFHPEGIKSFVGHHLRATIGNFLGIEWKFSMKDTSGTLIAVSVDSQLIIAEVIALTAIAVAGVLLFKRE